MIRAVLAMATLLSVTAAPLGQLDGRVDAAADVRAAALPDYCTDDLCYPIWKRNRYLSR